MPITYGEKNYREVNFRNKIGLTPPIPGLKKGGVKTNFCPRFTSV